jgi:glycosyltransferase involved in cell wall biosynthesis
MSAGNPEFVADLQRRIEPYCCPIRPHEQLTAERERLKDRLRDQRRKCHRLIAKMNSIEASLAWKVALRLSRLKKYVAPDHSMRLSCLRLALRGLRLWRREGTIAFTRRVIAAFLRPFGWKRMGTTASPPSSSGQDSATPVQPSFPKRRRKSPDRTWGANVPSERKFRVVFIGAPMREFQSMRYRAQHVIEALALAGLEAHFVEEEEVAKHSDRILAHDLIVLARVKYVPVIASLIEGARRRGIPVVYDIDDLIFEPWIFPYVEAFRIVNRADALLTMNQMSKCLDNCDYFTGSTPYLTETVASRGKKTFLLRNGMNSVQIEASLRALEKRHASTRDGTVRIGYFSGTRSHQDDFRIVYPALMAVLCEESKARLVIAGSLEIGEFPGLMPFAKRINYLPHRHWRDLPAAIAQVDINLIPLDMNPFNEGKSNLKYYEAGILKIPSIASPTRVLRESISHGHNGLLARTTDEWYQGLKKLIVQHDFREQLGQHAYEHVLRNYTPVEVSTEAVQTYRQIIRAHRSRRGIAEEALTIVILMQTVQGKSKETRLVLQRANELAVSGHAVTLLSASQAQYHSAESLRRFIARRFFAPVFAIQVGGEIPCCDVLLNTNPRLEGVARENAHRAHLLLSCTLENVGESARQEDPLYTAIHSSAHELDLLLRAWVENCPPEHRLTSSTEQEHELKAA